MLGRLACLPIAAKLTLNYIGLFLSAIAVFGVWANDWYALNDPHFMIGSLYLAIGFILGWLPGTLGLMGFIFLVPLSPNLHNQLNALLNLSIQAQANAGIDLAAGFFAGVVFQELFKVFLRKTPGSGVSGLMVFNRLLPPWPVALALCTMTLSALLAVSRNVWQSAAPVSIKGVLFNLQHFRPMGWHDDFMPLAQWMAYGLAGATLIVVMTRLGGVDGLREKNKVIFVPLMLGVIVAAVMGMIQARTGLGLLESGLEFRRDRIGYAAQGFQPDIHSFAAHMLIGVVGLWGYWFAFIRGNSNPFANRNQKGLWLVAMSFAWLGLIVSKSRFSLLIAVVTITLGGSIFLWRNYRRWFYPLVIALGVLVAGLMLTLFAYRNQSSFWMMHLMAQLQDRGFSSITAVGGIFGDRPEIFSAAIRMFQAFPLMGIGLGDFFRMSSNAAFSQSALLSVRGGENAHNYLLQILTETGLLGMVILGFATLAPILITRQRKPLIPVAIALFAVLLGNIYAHSLLIQENLILVAILLALAYSISWGEEKKEPIYSLGAIRNSKVPIFVASFCAILIFGALKETYQSFSAFPFEYGSSCFVPKPLTADGWSSGKTLGFQLPAGTHGIRLPVDITRPEIIEKPLIANLQIIGFRWSVLASSEVRWNRSGANMIEVQLPDQKISDGSIDAVLTLSTCYTPRNQGVSVDGRRLGVLIGKPEFF